MRLIQPEQGRDRQTEPGNERHDGKRDDLADQEGPDFPEHALHRNLPDRGGDDRPPDPGNG